MKVAQANAMLDRLSQVPPALPVKSSDSETRVIFQMLQKPQADHPIPSARFSDLTPIPLSELHPGTRASGRALHGTLAAEPIKQSVLILTVLELLDEEGEAILLAIKHAVKSQAGPEEVRAAFPRGARVVIKEPTLGEPLKGLRHFISLDNPANLVVLSYLPERQLDQILGGMSPEEIRAQGNALFFTGSFNSAAQAYRLSSDRAKNLKLDNPGDEFLALSNEAKCMLKLARFEDCVDVADEALGLDPAHHKTIHLKASALLKVHLYDWASSFLESFTGILQDDYSIDELRTRARKLAQQSNSSASVLEELTRYLERVTSAPVNWRAAGTTRTVTPPVNFPELAEYLGPVEVRKQEHNSGRGLFATRRIQRGEVLMVSNTVSLQKGEEILDCVQDGAVEVLGMVMRSPRAFQQINSLERDEVLEIPEMNLFRPNWITPGEWESYREESSKSPNSRELLQGINSKVILETVDKVSFISAAGCWGKKLSYGTWQLPSFINHCCVPNVARTLLGETTIFLATRGIEPGEEIGFSYICSGHPYRLQRLEEMGLSCKCLKCELQRRLETDLKEVSGCYTSSPDGSNLFNIKGGTDVPAIVIRLEMVLRTRLESEDERQCLRAVYWYLYEVYYGMVSLELGDNLVPGAEVIMAAARKFSAGTNGYLLNSLGRRYARDEALAKRMIREEWECRFGEMRDELYQLVEMNPFLTKLHAR